MLQRSVGASLEGVVPSTTRAGKRPRYFSLLPKGRIEEYLEAQELEGQAERVGKAVEAIVSGAEQLELTAAAVARFDEQLEQQAERLSSVTESIADQRHSTQADGVAEVILRDLAPR